MNIESMGLLELFNDFDIPWQDRDRVGAEVSFKGIYRRLFASKRDVFGEDATPHYNNEYVDNNRKRFELPPRVQK